jgi:hypothetical protein
MPRRTHRSTERSLLIVIARNHLNSAWILAGLMGLCLAIKPIPAQTLIMRNGDTLVCSTFVDKIHYTTNNVVCNGVTYALGDIRGRIDGQEYSGMYKGFFVPRVRPGRLALYKGSVTSMRYVDITSGVPNLRLVQREVECLSLDTGRLVLLTDSNLKSLLRANREAAAAYRRYYRIKNVSICLALSAFIPVALCIEESWSGRKVVPVVAISLPLLYGGISGFLVAKRRFYWKSIDIFNATPSQ